MKNNYFAIIFIYCCCLYTAFSYSKVNNFPPVEIKEIKEIKVISPHWINYSNFDGTGFYFDLFRLIYESPNRKISFDIVPWSRLVMYIDTNNADIGLGGTRDKKALQSKYPMDIETVVAISPKNSESDWLGMSSLKGKTLAIHYGYEFEDKIPVNFNLYLISTPAQAWKMLEAQRLDFYIENHHDAMNFLKENNFESNKYNFYPLWTEMLLPRFVKSAKGKALADIYDHRYPIIHSDGSLKALYDKYDIPYPNTLPSSLNSIQFFR
jgi:polar amino acid transport system substrate-binding protein